MPQNRSIRVGLYKLNVNPSRDYRPVMFLFVYCRSLKRRGRSEVFQTSPTDDDDHGGGMIITLRSIYRQNIILRGSIGQEKRITKNYWKKGSDHCRLTYSEKLVKGSNLAPSAY